MSMPIVQLSKLAQSLQNRFRQAKFLQVLLHQSDILMASERLLDTLERILRGGVLLKKNLYIPIPPTLNIYC